MADPRLWLARALHAGAEECIAGEGGLEIPSRDPQFRSVRSSRAIRGEPDRGLRLGCPQATAPSAVPKLASVILPVSRRGPPVPASRSRPAAGRPSSYGVPE